MYINARRSSWANVLIGTACFLMSIALGASSHEAIANGKHQSNLRIGAHESLPQSREIKLALNKALVVELPRELRDIMVSSPEYMDAVVQSNNRVHLIGKKIGQSNVFFFDTSGEQILTLEVSIDPDTGVLDGLLKRLIPGSNISSEILHRTVILTGSVRSPADSKRATELASRFILKDPDEDKRSETQVINMLAVEGEEQVMLRVVVAEVERSLMKQFGINMGASINSGSFSTSLLTENALPLTSALGLGTLPIPGIGTQALDAAAGASCLTSGVLCAHNTGPQAQTFGNSGIDSFLDTSRGRISKSMRALERAGLLRTLAEPNLTAISGESAKFLAGGEYPIPVVDSNGALSVTFKEFGVGVAFTPTVLSEGRISLKIETEVSELTTNGSVQLSNIAIPALKKRQANSTVELPSGGSMAMAGLISDDVRQNIDGFPGLKDLPILGTLFRSRDFVKRETELVVIVTPYVVKPSARKDLARPLDGLAAASDLKGIFLGHLNRIYGKGSHVPTGGLKGDYGFIVE